MLSSAESCALRAMGIGPGSAWCVAELQWDIARFTYTRVIKKAIISINHCLKRT